MQLTLLRNGRNRPLIIHRSKTVIFRKFLHQSTISDHVFIATRIKHYCSCQNTKRAVIFLAEPRTSDDKLNHIKQLSGGWWITHNEPWLFVDTPGQGLFVIVAEAATVIKIHLEIQWSRPSVFCWRCVCASLTIWKNPKYFNRVHQKKVAEELLIN